MTFVYMRKSKCTKFIAQVKYAQMKHLYAPITYLLSVLENLLHPQLRSYHISAHLSAFSTTSLPNTKNSLTQKKEFSYALSNIYMRENNGTTFDELCSSRTFIKYNRTNRIQSILSPSFKENVMYQVFMRYTDHRTDIIPGKVVPFKEDAITLIDKFNVSSVKCNFPTRAFYRECSEDITKDDIESPTIVDDIINTMFVK